MSSIWAYLSRTIQGMEQCFESDKTIAFLLAALLILWLKGKKTTDNKVNRLMVYTLVMAAVLLCPVTAALVGVYQTAFYDYEWAWSMVPVVIILAYTGVVLHEELLDELTKWKKVLAVGLVIMFLFVCISRGGILTVDAQENRARVRTSEIVACLDKEVGQEKFVLWAPKEIMQEVRRQTGELLLVYGKDMWDAKSGAYDYEAYSEEFIAAYEWMELIAVLAQDVATQEIFDTLYVEYPVVGKEKNYLCTMLDVGMNVLVLPGFAAEYFDDAVQELAEEYQRTVEKVYTQQYVLYLLK